MFVNENLLQNLLYSNLKPFVGKLLLLSTFIFSIFFIYS